jgi:hypothetical protein
MENKEYPNYYLFNYSGEKYPSADLTILKDDCSDKVVNIIPQKKHELSYDEYNGLLDLFYSDIKQDKFPNLEFIISKSDELHPQDILKNETIIALSSFADTANKSTGSAHPSDMKKWCNFICTAFKNNDYKNLSEYYLENFLIEDYNWPSDKAVNLVIEYTFAIELLKYWELF